MSSIGLEQDAAPDPTDRRSLSIADVSTATIQDEIPVVTARRLTTVFDLAFYQTQTGVTWDLAEAVRHYLIAGEAMGLAPHPLFDPAHVRGQLSDRDAESSGGRIFAAYLAAADRGIRLDPHPLFNARHYAAVAGLALKGPSELEYYVEALSDGQSPPSPCPLFDRGFYGKGDTGPCGLIDFVLNGARKRRAPHPLFDPIRFVSACAKVGLRISPATNPLTFYLTNRRAWQVPTHTLFDPVVFIQALADAKLDAPDDIPFLLHFLSLERDISTCFLFDPAFYRRHAAIRNITLNEPPVVHHARNGGLSGIAPHPLFSPAYYLDRYADVQNCRMDPLQHFIRHGRFEARDPHPLLALKTYGLARADGEEPTDDRFTHYLRTATKALGDPHPLFDAVLYAHAHPECLTSGATPLEHFISAWAARGVVCPPWGTALLERRPGANGPNKVDLIVVAHELTRTGAPLILLSLVRQFVERMNLGCLVLAHRPGVLLEAFREWAPVIDLTFVAEARLDPGAFIRSCVDAFEGATRPRAALVNTACVDPIGTSLARAGLPVITLVHELSAAFDQRVFDDIYAASSAVIYPASFVRRDVHTRYMLPIEKAEVIPQGLLNPAFGQVDRAAARREVLDQLEAPDDAFVVFGCGTLDWRKGIDLFATVAMAAITKAESDDTLPPSRPLYFFWVGGGATQRFSPAWYVEKDIERSGLGGRIRFLGPRAETETLFAGSNAFILTSRMDPFPCVVHEAMACALPVIAFDDAGGAPEALDAGAGIIVPYGDVQGMADALLRLIADPSEARTIGARARQRVSRCYAFDAYADAVADAFARRTGVALRPDPAAASALAGRRRRNRVIFTVPRITGGSADRARAALMSGLDARGFDTELILTSDLARSAPRTAGSTRQPRLLLTSSRRPPGSEHIRDQLRSILESVSPAIVVSSRDEDDVLLAPGLPRHIRVIGTFGRADARLTGKAPLTATHRHGAIVPSTLARSFILAQEPRLVGYCDVIPPAFPDAAMPELDQRGGPMRVLAVLRAASTEGAARSIATLIDAVRDLDCVVTVLGQREGVETITGLFASPVADGKLKPVIITDDRAMWSALQSAEVFVALDNDPDALVGIDEAMHAGLAVINAAGRAGLEAWQRAEEVGPSVARGDFRSLRRELVRFVADPRRRLRCRTTAYELARAHSISFDECINRHATLFERVLGDLRHGRLGSSVPAGFAP